MYVGLRVHTGGRRAPVCATLLRTTEHQRRAFVSEVTLIETGNMYEIKFLYIKEA